MQSKSKSALCMYSKQKQNSSLYPESLTLQKKKKSFWVQKSDIITYVDPETAFVHAYLFIYLLHKSISIFQNNNNNNKTHAAASAYHSQWEEIGKKV